MTTSMPSRQQPLMAPHPSSPHLYARRVLLCGAGLSPPVITETLYALTVQRQRYAPTKSPAPGRDSFPVSQLLTAGDNDADARPLVPEPFVPTEIQVVTTRRGRDELVRNLLGPDGWFTRFLSDYPQGQAIRFDESCIHVIGNAGRGVEDIETAEDSLLAGTTIVSVVKDLASDPNCAIHASIAGGRRQMSFLLGMTMSLLGREQDRLSHVLVSAAFETRGFYYPTPYEHPIQTRDQGIIDARDARLVLAEMPLLRVFDGMASGISKGALSFADLVVMSQRVIERPPIEVLPEDCTLKVGHAACRLGPQEMFFYGLLALRRKQLCAEPGVKPGKLGAVVLAKRTSVGMAGPLADTITRQVPVGVFDPLQDPEGLRVLVTKLNAKLVRAFGKAMAERLKVVGPGGSKDGHYGLLNAQPEDIRMAACHEA